MTDKQLEQIFREHGPALRRLALSRCNGHDSDAKDLFGETWLRAVRWKDRYVDRGTPFRWLALILAHAHVSSFRKRRVRGEVFSDDMGWVEQEEAMEYPWYLDLTDEQVRTGVDELPAELRESYRMFVHEGLAQPVIAAALGITSVAVAGRVFRARAELRKILSARFGPGPGPGGDSDPAMGPTP